MNLTQGASVRTPDGQIGRVIKPSTNGGSPRPFNLDGEADVSVYTLLMESGEVRQFSYRALLDASGEVRRSGSLK